MSEFLPRDLRLALEEARKLTERRRSRMRIHAGDAIYPVLRYWGHGFSIDAASVSHMRGLVDLYDGSRHLKTCLVIASEVEEGELICSMKRATEASDRAPLDFARDENAPVAYLPPALLSGA